MSLAQLLKQKQQALAANRKSKTIKPANGRGRYRILPSWRGVGEQFWHDFGQHFVKDAKKEIKAIYMCTEKTHGRDCEVCAAIAEAIKATTDDATMELLKEAKSAQSILLNVLHVDGDKPTEVQILEIRPTLFEQIIGIATEWEEAGQSILDITAGKEIVITREGTGKNTKYTAMPAATNTGTVPGDVLKRLHNLDEYVKQESNEGAQRALTSVRSVSGLLPAPSGIPTAARLPAAAAAAGGAATIEDDYAVAASPVRTGATPSVAETSPFEDVPELAVKPTPAPAAAPVAAPAAAPAGPAAADLDPELAKMLAELG